MPMMHVRSRMLASAVPIALFLATVVIIVFSLICMRTIVSGVASAHAAGSFSGSFLGAFIIITMNLVYKKMARRLNDFENHRTEIDYDTALTKKIFLFQFVNVFASLYYLGFFKRSFAFFGIIDAQDDCFITYGDLAGLDRDDTRNTSNGCMTETALQLGSLMVVNLLFGQFQELIRPKLKVWLKNKGKRSKEAARSGGGDGAASASAAAAARRPEWEEQALLNNYEGTFDEYNEMVLQFAMVVVFATAFPMAPFLALVNNIVEVRTDAMKFLNTTKKPFYKGANSIGGWSAIIAFVIVCAITTNAALQAFSFPALTGIFLK